MAPPPLKDAAPVVANYATNVHANYTDALAKAKELQVAIDAFVASPTKDTQDALAGRPTSQASAPSWAFYWVGAYVAFQVLFPLRSMLPASGSPRIR